eukprot:PRCOL_00004640-RA
MAPPRARRAPQFYAPEVPAPAVAPAAPRYPNRGLGRRAAEGVVRSIYASPTEAARAFDISRQAVGVALKVLKADREAYALISGLPARGDDLKTFPGVDMERLDTLFPTASHAETAPPAAAIPTPAPLPPAGRTYADMLRRGLEYCTTGGMSYRAAAREASKELAAATAATDQSGACGGAGTSMVSHQTLRSYANTYLEGTYGTPAKAGRVQYLPDAIERVIVQTIAAMREQKWPVYKADVKAWVAHAVEGSSAAAHFLDETIGRPPTCPPLAAAAP